ncbi:CHAD domain-containing protein [Streptomyces sparsogenes]
MHRLSGAGAPADAAADAPGGAPGGGDGRGGARGSGTAGRGTAGSGTAGNGAVGSGAVGNGAVADAPAQRPSRAARRSVSLTADTPQDPPGMPSPPSTPGPSGTPGPRGSGTASGTAEAGQAGQAGQPADAAVRSGGAALGPVRQEQHERPAPGAATPRGDRTHQRPGGGAGARSGGGADEARGGALTVGAARAGALLERQLTLARTRAHTAALQALGSSRFHAVADAVALLASEVPLDEAAAARPAELALPPLAELAQRRLAEAVEALPLGRAGHPYNAEALIHGLAATPAADAPPASERQDAPWHQVRRLLRLRRYALEVLDAGDRPDGSGPAEADLSLSVRLLAAGQALERHRDAAEAAAAAAAAARTPRIAPATAYALGVLHADQRHEVEAARFAFGRIWQRTLSSAF